MRDARGERLPSADICKKNIKEKALLNCSKA